MSALFNHYAMGRAQAAWDAMEPDYDDPPVSMSAHMEVVEKNSLLEDQVTRLIEIGRDLAETANRIRCCTGDRMLQLCNEIEGVEDDE